MDRAGLCSVRHPHAPCLGLFAVIAGCGRLFVPIVRLGRASARVVVVGGLLPEFRRQRQLAVDDLAFGRAFCSGVSSAPARTRLRGRSSPTDGLFGVDSSAARRRSSNGLHPLEKELFRSELSCRHAPPAENACSRNTSRRCSPQRRHVEDGSPSVRAYLPQIVADDSRTSARGVRRDGVDLTASCSDMPALQSGREMRGTIGRWRHP